MPWLQKGDAVELPLGTTAPIQSDGTKIELKGQTSGNTGSMSWNSSFGLTQAGTMTNGEFIEFGASPGLQADLSSATAATINELRQAFQIQKLLERDARSGTRYAEIVKSHFGVNFIDVTYRPEFLGGTSTPVNIHTVPHRS